MKTRNAEKHHTEIDKVKRRYKLLYEVSQAIVSNRYAEEILLLVVSLTAELMRSKICSLMLLDEEKQELQIRATQSLSEGYRNKPAIHIGESVSGRAVLERKPIAVLDVTKDKKYKYPKIARAEGLKSLVSVPMMTRSKVVGVLNCYTSEEREFTKGEIQILVGVANQAALAIENTKLLAEKVTAVENLESRKKIDRAKSILIKRHGVDEVKAHRMIQKQSMEKRRSLKEIAEAIIVSEDVAA
jgi:two-component system, response regulator PdtaR